MKGRARLTRCSRTAEVASTAPPWAPRDLLSVSVPTTSLRPPSPACVQQAAATGPGDAQRVGLVGDEHGSPRGADLGQLGDRRGVAEDGVDRLDQHHRARVGARGQHLVHGGDVVVGDHLHRGPAEPAGVDHRGVHVGVGDDQGVGVGQGGDGREVGVVAGREHQRGREPGERGQRLLELLVEAQRAGDQARGARAGAVLLGRRDRALDHPRVPGQAEVVVAGQVDHRLRRVPGDQAAGQPGVLALLGLLRQPVLEGVHATTSQIAAVIVARSSSEVTYGGIV